MGSSVLGAAFAGVVGVALLGACTEPEPEHTLVVRGRITTGAHAGKPLASAWVGILGPQGPKGGHWIRYVSSSASGLANETLSSEDGTYRYETEVLGGTTVGIPYFIAVSDAEQTFTMLAELPRDLMVEGAEITIDVDPATTAASQLVCPGGVFPPPAGAWCYSDPSRASTRSSELVGILREALAGSASTLETGTPPAWAPFLRGLLADPATLARVEANLVSGGITVGNATPASIAGSVAALPLVHPGKSTSSPAPSGSGCRLVWDCGASSQCATVYGAKTGSAAEPDAATCASICKSQGACTCQGC